MSAILSVDDLNDFISPGVACIKPVETLPVVIDNLVVPLVDSVLIACASPLMKLFAKTSFRQITQNQHRSLLPTV